MIIIKKLTDSQAKEIIGGSSVSGALLSGIASIAKEATDFILDVAALPLVYIESSKNHDKATFKLGSTTVEYDDTTSIKVLGETPSKVQNNVADLQRSLDSSSSSNYDNSSVDSDFGTDLPLFFG